MTVLISSHNLKEMEGICDAIGILQKGKMAIERDLDELKSDVHKVQAAYPANIAPGREKYGDLDIKHFENRGSIEIFNIYLRNGGRVQWDPCLTRRCCLNSSSATGLSEP